MKHLNSFIRNNNFLLETLMLHDVMNVDVFNTKILRSKNYAEKKNIQHSISYLQKCL